MADIDQIIAGGAGASSRADFSGFDGILKNYWEGKDQRAKNDLRDAFKGGVPTLPDGTPDFGSMAKTLFQKGGLSEGTALIGAAIGPAERAKLNEIDGGQPSQQPIVSPTTSRNTVTIDPSKRPDISPAGAQPQAQDQPTIMKVLAAQGIPNDQLGAASASIARQIGIDPSAPLNLQDPQVRNVLAPAVAQIKKMGLGQVQPPQPGDNPQVMAQGAPQAATQSALQASPVQVAAQNDPILKRLTLLTASPDKATAAAAKVRLEAYLKNNEATGPMKEAAASGLSLKDYQERQGEQAAQQAGATERAKADVKEQQEYIDGGKQASSRLTTLNTLSNIIGSDPNINLGFGGPTALKVKMALESLGVPVPDLSGAQAIQKLNASLASEMAKSLTSRTTQFEFKTFLGNNPGLELDKSGNERLIGIFSQLAKRDVDLGKLARQNQDNWQKWDQVVENYDKKNPMRDPVTKKVLSTDTVIAPGQNKGAAPSSGSAQAATLVSSKADYDKLPKGAKFTGPDGKPWQKP